MKYIIGSSYIHKNNDEVIVLKANKWDDYSKKTSFDALYYADNGDVVNIGTIKIGKEDLEVGWTKDHLESSFDRLPNGFFSLWQSADSYKRIKEISEKTGANIFEDLRDVAYDTSMLELYKGQPALEESLLRFNSRHMCINQYHRIAIGEIPLTSFFFSYIVKQDDGIGKDLKLGFQVLPGEMPPTNVYAFIGNNGTGKTTLIKNMIRSICKGNNNFGLFEYDLKGDEYGYFEKVICISFSPFDDYSDMLDYENFNYIGIKKDYSNVGRDKGQQGEDNSSLLYDIRNKFIESFKNCMGNSTKKDDWKDMINMFYHEGDDSFASNDFLLMGTSEENLNFENTTKIEALFDKLSAGHKVVMSIITRCIDKLAEKSILFLDEPENHLHPPLLSTMIRGISKMLIKRNGVAVISTHSPIILQEIPKKCVFHLQRNGGYLFGDHPAIETFGTNIGVLTNEIFGYEVKRAGFNILLKESVEKHNTYEEVLNEFDNQLGNEAKNMVRILLAQKGKNICES